MIKFKKKNCFEIKKIFLDEETFQQHQQGTNSSCIYCDPATSECVNNVCRCLPGLVPFKSEQHQNNLTTNWKFFCVKSNGNYKGGV